MELVKLGEKTYCIKNRTNIGIYLEDDNNIWLIDTGNDDDTAKAILKITEENSWHIKGIINTHSHSDHCGGNNLIEKRTNCLVLASPIEEYFIRNNDLEGPFLYGAKPFENIISKNVKAKNSHNVKLVTDFLPAGLEIIYLPGHCYNMIGIKTSDNVYFLGDGLISSEIINKYHVFYIYDIASYLESLDKIENLTGNYFIPSHSDILTSPKALITENRNKMFEIINAILDYLKEKHVFDDIVKHIFDHYNLRMSNIQYYLVGDSIKAYLAYLINNEFLETVIEDNYFYFHTINN